MRSSNRRWPFFPYHVCVYLCRLLFPVNDNTQCVYRQWFDYLRSLHSGVKAYPPGAWRRRNSSSRHSTSKFFSSLKSFVFWFYLLFVGSFFTTEVYSFRICSLLLLHSFISSKVRSRVHSSPVSTQTIFGFSYKYTKNSNFLHSSWHLTPSGYFEGSYTKLHLTFSIHT